MCEKVFSPTGYPIVYKRLYSFLTDEPHCLYFNYHMYGTNTGTLRVDYSNQGGSFNGIWSKSGNQGDVWTAVAVDIPSDSTAKVCFDQYDSNLTSE